MSATAFQRLRREALAKKQSSGETVYDMTAKQLKETLDSKGIEYDPKAKKDELIKLLEEAE